MDTIIKTEKANTSSEVFAFQLYRSFEILFQICVAVKA